MEDLANNLVGQLKNKSPDTWNAGKRYLDRLGLKSISARLSRFSSMASKV